MSNIIFLFKFAVVFVGLIVAALWIIRLSRVHTEHVERQRDRRLRRERQRRYYDDREEDRDDDDRYRYISGEYADLICH